MLNHFVFKTEGDWDTTTLFNNGEEFPASQLYVELHAGRNEFGEPAQGGIRLGGEIDAYVAPQDNPSARVGMFPGRLEMYFPGHSLMIENTHPAFAFEFTRVFYNGQDVTNHVVDLLVNIDAVNDQVSAYITLYKAHWLGPDEVATFTIL
ncbi:MAG TPA: hypothetical protein VKV18_02675 [Chthonomonas sp.]|uniref:hypothetical protein n=1 Tax=Chthonomonas sp. TaxID=2282153 RepID=UPI002B4AE643|nr:hypothetical protein [Chthonomonas sp.]HLI47584.1 hypothetical protein [Chthonomonas sp.]